jgi:hypothetical protein
MKAINFKVRMFADRIFVIAIIASAVWHIFWLSIVNVVAVQKESSAVKYSKVSFLGPILERGALEVRIEPSQRSFLEKRYLDLAEKDVTIGDVSVIAGGKEPEGKDYFALSDEKLSGLIKDAVSASKLEPAYGME